MTQTRANIIDETRGTDYTPLAHYTSEPYDTMGDDDQPVETTCTVDVTIRGNAALGYILHTSDEADGPSDQLGTTVYPTEQAAIQAMESLVLARPDGWIEIVASATKPEPEPQPERRWEIGDGRGREIVVRARGANTIDLAQRIYDRCDECLQASDMLEFFPGRPDLHETTLLHRAMFAAGCEIVRPDGWTESL